MIIDEELLIKYSTVRLEDNLVKLNISFNKQQICQLLKYYEMLIHWNTFMNLTAITEFEDVIIKHYIDSVSLVKAVPDLGTKEYKIIDIGTGAGFPGIPLKIMFPQLKITLLDSLNKRVQFLNEVISELKLEDIEAVHGRAEDFARQNSFREFYDLCVSRAVANLSTLSEYCLPFVKPNGLFISYKSEKIKDEYEEAKKAIMILGGKYKDQVEFILPGSDIYRNLFLIKKEKNTPLKYPRKAGLPSKEPISW